MKNQQIFITQEETEHFELTWDIRGHGRTRIIHANMEVIVLGAPLFCTTDFDTSSSVTDISGDQQRKDAPRMTSQMNTITDIFNLWLLGA